MKSVDLNALAEKWEDHAQFSSNRSEIDALERCAKALRSAIAGASEDGAEPGWPTRIYLAPPPTDENRTWCEDQIEDDWREYVLVPAPPAAPEERAQ